MRRVHDQTKFAIKLNEIGPGHVGTVDVKHVVLNMSLKDPEKCCMKPAWSAGIEQKFE